MTTKKIPFNYDINRMLAVDLIAIIHIDDYDTRFLELTMFDDGTPFSVDGCTVTSRFVTISESYLLSDNVPCEATGNTITIPIDAAVVQMMACDIKIEVNIVDGEKKLTLPFPLWVRMRGSILEVAHVTPESRGTIPELLEAAQEALDAATAALEDAGDYSKLDNKPQINGHTLSGNKTSDELGLQNKLTAGENVNIDANGNITITGVTKYRNVPTEQVDDCIENGVLYALYISELQSNAQIIANNNYTTITQHALLDDGRLMYRMRQGETPWQPAGEWSAWESIGGSQIVSGVVNQNGTITFTNSDGTTFTTTGTSVIGFSPTATVTQTASGATVSITDKNGTTTANILNGADGQDYVLTAQDKSDIANIVLGELPTTQGVLYGNTSN